MARIDIKDQETLVLLVKECITHDDMSMFYTSKEWRRLRRKVLKQYKGECQPCKARGYYRKANTVHHHMEVRDYPELALSEHYTDSNGEHQPNLIPVCPECHRVIHGDTAPEEPITKERW